METASEIASLSSPRRLQTPRMRLAWIRTRRTASTTVKLDDQANSLVVNTNPVETDHAAHQHFKNQTTVTTISKEASLAKVVVDETEDPGHVAAEVSAGTINTLALKMTASSSSALKKKTTFSESVAQHSGKRKRQPARDTPVSPSKQIIPERGRSGKDRGDSTVGGQQKLGSTQLARPNRALIGKSTNKRSMLASTKDVFSLENISPAKTEQVFRSRTIDQDQTEGRTGKRTTKSSPSEEIVGIGAEKGSPIMTDAPADHVSYIKSGSTTRRVVTGIPPKPKGRPRKQQQPAQSSTSDSKSTRSRTHALRSINHSMTSKSRDLSQALEHNPNAKPSVSTAERAMPSPRSSKTVRTHAGAPEKVKPIRKVGAPTAESTAERTCSDESDSLDSDGTSSRDEQATSGDLGVRRSSSEGTVCSGSRYGDDGPEGEDMDDSGEEVGAEAEDDIDYADRTELNNKHQVKPTTRFLLRGPDWKKVIEGANTVGVSNNSKKVAEDIPELKTKTIIAFVKQVRRTSKFYKDSRRRDEVEPNVQELAHQVELIDEDRAGTKACAMIQDIYAHAIPELIFMLDHALDVREADCSLSDNVKGLKEIIRLQDIVIHLCEKARDWTKDPTTDRPIKKSTTQKIFPYLRSMQQTLREELSNRRREILRKKDEAAAEAERSRVEEEMRHKGAEDERERLAIWDNIIEQLDRNERVLFPRKTTRPSVAIPQLGEDDWTVEQELVLNKYLEEFGDLPGEC